MAVDMRVGVVVTLGVDVKVGVSVDVSVEIGALQAQANTSGR
jgi:hypothetical protein